MTETSAIVHPTLDGRPVLIGDRLVARCEWDEGPAVDIEFEVVSIVPDNNDFCFSGRMSWTPFCEEFLFLGNSCRRAPDNGSTQDDS